MVDQEVGDVDMTAQNDSEILVNPISTEEVIEACRSLKGGKAPGLDGIQGEHLKYAGPITYSYIGKLFNCMAPSVNEKGYHSTNSKRKER